MEGRADGQGVDHRWDEYVPAASPLPRTIRRIVREELGPLIELLERLRTELSGRDPGIAEAAPAVLATPPTVKDEVGT